MNQPSPVEISHRGPWCVARCSTQNLSEADVLDRFESACHDLLADHKPRFLAFNLDGVQFVMTRVLSSLLMLHKRQREAGGCLALCGLDPNVARVLRLTRLDRVFDIYADLETLLTQRPDGPPRAAAAPGFGP